MDQTAEPKDQRVPVMMGKTEVEAVDEWMFSNRVRSRSEAIRQLVALGLRASGEKSSEPANRPVEAR